jgi:hypothetical protein
MTKQSTVTIRIQPCGWHNSGWLVVVDRGEKVITFPPNYTRSVCHIPIEDAVGIAIEQKATTEADGCIVLKQGW